jgi:hypothetical protein
MRGYISEFASRRGPDWPHSWAVAETAPDRWIGTLPLHELMEMLDNPLAETRLDGIEHHWDDDELVLRLGPVALRGVDAQWRALARRILRSAQGADRLYDAPAARPWSGATVEMSPRDVLVPSRKPHPAIGPKVTADVTRLAEAGGFTPSEFVDLFGSAWVFAKENRYHLLDYMFDEELELYFWGEPPQLAAMLGAPGLVLGTPHGHWDGPGKFVVEITNMRPVSGSMPRPEVRDIVHELLGARRRSFTWCRYCGRQLVPERRPSRDLCYGCETAINGTVR